MKPDMVNVEILEEMVGEVEEIVLLLTLLINSESSDKARDAYVMGTGMTAVRSLVERLGEQIDAAVDVAHHKIPKIPGKYPDYHSCVSYLGKEMEERGQLCESHSSIGADGKQYPRQVEHMNDIITAAYTFE